DAAGDTLTSVHALPSPRQAVMEFAMVYHCLVSVVAGIVLLWPMPALAAATPTNEGSVKPTPNATRSGTATPTASPTATPTKLATLRPLSLGTTTPTATATIPATPTMTPTATATMHALAVVGSSGPVK